MSTPSCSSVVSDPQPSVKRQASEKVPPRDSQPLTLMIDADDTLWENNIFFEEAIDRFIDLLDHPHLQPAEVRDAFDRLEADRVRIHGYGVSAFQRSLLAGFEHLRGTACTAEEMEHIRVCADAVRLAEIRLLDGVLETLPLLARRHRLILVTKGDPGEQLEKLDRSGLGAHFHHAEVLREKHESAYRLLLQQYECNPGDTWMIGNSPRSDVNPALAAGCHAAYLPHPSTWTLEREELQTPSEGRHLLHLESFRDLLLHFE